MPRGASERMALARGLRWEDPRISATLRVELFAASGLLT